MAEPGLTELAATSLRRRAGKIANNTGNNNPITFRMEKAGNIVKGVTGRTLVEEHDYVENGTVMAYEGGEVLNTASGPVLSAFEYDWKQIAGSLVMTGLEEIQNGGPERSISLLQGRLNNLERALKNRLENDIRSDGTGNGGKQIGGLDLLIAEDPTSGTVGGVNRATSNYARNYFYGVVAQTGAAMTVTNIERIMRLAMTETFRAGDTNRLWILGNTYWQLFNEAAGSRQRLVDKEMAALGFDNFKLDGTTVALGGGYRMSGNAGSAMETTKGYLLNLDYMRLQVGKGRFFDPLKDRESTNQDSMVRFLAFAGNMTCSNFGLQGVVFDS